MNRIILIGNGFDKAIGLPTLYSDFMNWFINTQIIEINQKIDELGLSNNQYLKERIFEIIRYTDDKQDDFKNDFITINSIDVKSFNNDIFFEKSQVGTYYRINYNHIEVTETLKRKSFKENTGLKNNSLIIINNKILDLLIENYNLNNTWGDIEQIFYNQLIITNDSEIERLNNDFQLFIKKLEDYLKTIDIQKIIDSKDIDFINHIRNNIYSEDLKPNQLCPTFVKEKLDSFRISMIQNDRDSRKIIMDKIGFSGTIYNQSIVEHIKKYNIELKLLSDQFIINNYLYLNFNYTSTPKYFIDREKENIYLNIHGDLSENENTPVIFGFGDELDENYKIIEDKNDNEYLKHIKSINYLHNENYRKLIEVLESDHYQVLIFGHSCGLSDRTLLNTIFEHDNCVSIIPFTRHDRDNYQDIIMNIYRNFTDKRKLRKRVVNKELVKTLTIKDKKENE